MKFESNSCDRENETSTDFQQNPTNFLNLLKSIPDTQPKEVQIAKVKQIKLITQQLGMDNAKFLISKEFCTELKKQIGEGRAEIEKSLIDVVLSISKVGADIVNQGQKNKFFVLFLYCVAQSKDRIALLIKLIMFERMEHQNRKERFFYK
ncbi:MAG: hypothetical protein EZS28_015258 [Streblomastix strix]|uniref:Uncharacterized protein n=1 Tax=Streblomastix strix TaxID=222440 RepID=A0A5J4W318_9EUKA|nr:MAG: hypothetical protein EZS28_015258 [Streblomastix strix]